MAHVISVGQTYQHQDGDEYEVVTVDKGRVTFETPSGSIVCMDIDELMSNLDEGVLLPIVDANGEEDDDDEGEDRED
ncbi:MAG: hypothetical protein ACE10E_10980 [Acidiferrobacterales bacterium]